MLEQTDGYVKSEKHGQAMFIEFFHPLSNSLPRGMLTDLASHIHGAGQDDEVHVIVIKSFGDRAFCAGASFTELALIKNFREGEEFFNGFAHLLNCIRKCPKFIIARIQGKCVGGGVGIAAAADYVIAHASADIKLSELEIGIAPFVVGPAIERKIGLSAFSQLTIDAASWRTADWAKTRGLYAEVHANLQDLDDSLERLIKHLSRSSLPAIKEIKKVLWQGTSHWDQLLPDRAKISGYLVTSEIAQKAIAAFRPKD
jgi:methylglutaconyl-CoA hydratase